MSDKPSVPPCPDSEVASDARMFDSDVASYWLAAIVESAEDAIISKTLDGVITSWNKGAERIFGYTKDEIIGRHISVLIPPDHLNEEPAILAQLRRGEKIEHYETVRSHKNGDLLDISLTVSPIYAADGTIIGASKIARDIRRQKTAEIALQRALADAQQARQQAEEANRLRDQFLSTISHELRTPLTAVMGWTAMLRSGRLDDVMAHKALETIDRNVKSQAQLIEDLLDISRIVNGKMHIESKLLNLSPIIHSAVDSVMPAAQARDISLQIIIDPAIDSVCGDPDRLRQVIWNLLSNAIKFTPRGGHVQIRAERSDSYVELSVSDDGVGIHPEFLPHIFERFTQQDSSSTRNYGGLGMGLAIVKSIVEMHGGLVTAYSAGPDKGAEFTISLPRPKEKATLPLPMEASLDLPALEFPAELNGLRILVVDDEVDTCEMIRVAFEQCGSIIKTATSAPQALAQLDKWQPDMLISDISMPQTDGYQLIEQIRERQPQSDTKLPAIALTALARIEDRVKALGAGYQMHVAKPIELPELYAVVSSLASVISRSPETQHEH